MSSELYYFAVGRAPGGIKVYVQMQNYKSQIVFERCPLHRVYN